MQANIQAVRGNFDHAHAALQVVMDSDSEDEQDEPTSKYQRIKHKAWLTMENSQYSRLVRDESVHCP